jgi:large subunit ribosomal protein L4
MQATVKNSEGRVVDTVELDERLFNVPMNSTLVHQAMVMYQANRRQGTHSTKTKAQVSGGGRKPWPQKHTGRARHGSIRSPQWRHGGVTFGPHPRSHRLDMPKKMRQGALRCVLSDKFRSGKLALVDDITVGFSTKSMADLLSNLEVGRSTLIVTESPAESMVRSARNLPRVWTLPVDQLTAEQLLKRDTLVMTLDAMRKAEQLWASPSVRRPKKGTLEAPPALDESPEPEESVELDEAVEVVAAVESGEPVSGVQDEEVEE